MVRWLTVAAPLDPGWSSETWSRFRLACQVHGLGPLLQQKLSAAPWVEAETQAWLAGQYRLNGQRLAKIHVELQAILRQFQAEGMAVMPLKGSILSTRFYADPALRPMADLDLLVRPENWTGGAVLLTELGYEQGTVHWKHTEFFKPDNRQVASRQGEHPDNPRGVELHRYCRETFGGPSIDLTQAMWSQATVQPMLGTEVLLPPPELVWLHLLVHATYHFWQGKGRLIQLVDLSLLTPHLADPASVLQAVEARYTYPALCLLRQTFPEAVPATLLAAQAERVAPRFRRWAAGLNLVNGSYLNPKPPGLYFFKALRFSGGRPGEIAQALRFSLLPRPEELALDHPHLARPWLAYFLLPLDWLKRLARNRLD